jgi:hypothetical protein
MRHILFPALFATALLLPIGAVHAQPANMVTATCKDGTTFSGATRSGACRGHGGVKSWGKAETTTSPSGLAPTSEPAKAPSAGGSPGQVWVNTATKVYHCPGTRWYGKTKKGEYMSEPAAKAQGARPDHGKACTS